MATALHLLQITTDQWSLAWSVYAEISTRRACKVGRIMHANHMHPICKGHPVVTLSHPHLLNWECNKVQTGARSPSFHVEPGKRRRAGWENATGPPIQSPLPGSHSHWKEPAFLPVVGGDRKIHGPIFTLGNSILELVGQQLPVPLSPKAGLQ